MSACSLAALGLGCSWVLIHQENRGSGGRSAGSGVPTAKLEPSRHLGQIGNRDRRDSTVRSVELREYIVRLDLAKAAPRGKVDDMMASILREAASSYPEFVARELPSSGLPHSVMMELSRYLVKRWDDPKKALDWADGFAKGGDRGGLIGMALGKYVKTDPDPATRFVANMPRGGTRNEAFRLMMDGWASSDPDAAWKFAESSADARNSSEVWIALSQEMVGKDVKGSMARLSVSDDSDRSASLARSIVLKRIETEDPSVVLEWAASLPGSVGTAARDSAVVAWAERDAAAASSYFAKSADPALRSRAPLLAASWSEQDPAAAARWVGSFDDPALQGEMIAKVIDEWLGTSPQAATKWLGTLPEGHARDKGIITMLRREMVSDPASFFPWVDSLSTLELRESKTREIQNLIESENFEINRKR